MRRLLDDHVIRALRWPPAESMLTYRGWTQPQRELTPAEYAKLVHDLDVITIDVSDVRYHTFLIEPENEPWTGYDVADFLKEARQTLIDAETREIVEKARDHGVDPAPRAE